MLKTSVELPNFSEEQMKELSYHSISELSLSVRAVNSLCRIDCKTLDKLVSISETELRSIKGLGSKTCNEILDAIGGWIAENPSFLQETFDTENIPEKEKKFFEAVSEKMSPVVKMHWRNLREIVNKSDLIELENEFAGGIPSDATVVKIIMLQEFSKNLMAWCHRIIPEGIFKYSDIEELFAESGVAFDIKLLFDAFLEENIMVMSDYGYCYEKRPFVSRYIKRNFANSENRKEQILYARLQGEKLQKIGDDFGLTREGVRLVCDKMAKTFPEMHEDYYKVLFKTFKFSKDEFCHIFPECGPTGYEYLFVKCKKGNKELSSENIEQYGGIFKEKLHAAFDKLSLKKDKETITRTDMTFRVLLENGDQSVSYEQFEKLYYEYIERHGYPLDRLILKGNSTKNLLRNSKKVVYNGENKFRYCEVDHGLLWETIDFKQYRNSVISTELIYRDYNELMDELDLKDGYELFYAIKTSVEEYWDNKEFNIDCRRIPMLVIGSADDGTQAVNLLKEISPVSFEDYFATYEERYGVKRSTARGNSKITSALSVYYDNGTYATDVPTIADVDVEPFLNALSKKNLWLRDELKECFIDVCKHSSIDAINEAAFKRIGYSLNAAFAYPDKFGNAHSFFDQEIFNTDVIDLSQYDSKLLFSATFCSVLTKKKQSLEYIEVAPKLLMSNAYVQRLYNISLEDLEEIQAWARACEEKFFNAHSVWEKLKEEPFFEKLQNNKWMCTCIFRQQETVFSHPVSNGIILCKDNEQLNLTFICEWIFEKYGRMTINDFTAKLNAVFDTKIPVYKVAEKIKANNKWDLYIADSFDSYIDEKLIENNN